MRENSKYRRYTISLIIVFIFLSVITTINPEFIAETITQSLIFPVFILSIIATLQLITENALRLCENNYKDIHYRMSSIEDLRKFANDIVPNIGDMVLEANDDFKTKIKDINDKKVVFQQIEKIIIKCCTFIGIVEVIALVLFLLSIILQFSFIKINNDITTYWSLTIMLTSTCFSSSISIYFVNTLKKHIENRKS